MKTLKSLMNFIMGIVLTFSMLGLMVSLFSREAMLNPKFYKRALQRGEYYTNLNEEIRDGFKNYSLITSVPEEIFQDNITDQEIIDVTTRNIDSTIEYMRGNGEYRETLFVSDKLREGLSLFIKEYGAENGIKVTDELNSQMDNVYNESTNIVSNHAALVQLSPVIKFKEFRDLKEALGKIHGAFYYLMAAVVISGAAIVFVNKKKITEAFLWIGGGLAASALMLIVPAATGMAMRIAYRFNVANEYLKIALREITLGYLRFFLVGGMGILALGVMTLILFKNKSEEYRYN